MCTARYTFGCVSYVSLCHPWFFTNNVPQILWRHASQPTLCHERSVLLRPQLHTRRASSCQYRQYQLDVSDPTAYPAVSLTDFYSVGIVIIAIISLFVSDCSPLRLHVFLIAWMYRGPFVE